MWFWLIFAYMLVSCILAFIQFTARVVFTPKYFYNKFMLNWFGACLFGIPALILNLVFYICMIIVILFEVFKFLITVGHKY